MSSLYITLSCCEMHRNLLIHSTAMSFLLQLYCEMQTRLHLWQRITQC